MRFLVKILISSLAILVTAYILPGVHLDNYLIAILVAAVLSFLNAFVKPLLVILTIPATIVTLGLFLVVINALIVMLADYIVDDFEVTSFWWALLFSLVLSLVTSIFESIDKPKQNDSVQF